MSTVDIYANSLLTLYLIQKIEPYGLRLQGQMKGNPFYIHANHTLYHSYWWTE